MTLIRDDIGVNMGRADRAHQAADGTRAELRSLGDEVNSIYRMIKTLEAQVRNLSEPGEKPH